MAEREKQVSVIVQRSHFMFHVHRLCAFLLSSVRFSFVVVVVVVTVQTTDSSMCVSRFFSTVQHLNSYRIVNKTWISSKWRHKIAYYFPLPLILLFYKFYYIFNVSINTSISQFWIAFVVDSVIHLTCRQNINFDTNKKKRATTQAPHTAGDFWLHVATHFYFVWPYYRIKYLNKSQYSYIILLLFLFVVFCFVSVCSLRWHA